MTTEKQTLANRLNALKGGVKTPEGKAVSRLNAISHGFYSQFIVVPGEDIHLFNLLRDKYMAEFKPVGEMETLLVERVVTSAWRLRRVLLNESKHMHPNADFRHLSWENTLRLDTTLERQIYKALHELERLQKTRLHHETPQAPKPDLSSPSLSRLLSQI